MVFPLLGYQNVCFIPYRLGFLAQKRPFGPKYAFLGSYRPCWFIWCPVGWWLWRAGCISQDTYLLYVIFSFQHFPLPVPSCSPKFFCQRYLIPHRSENRYCYCLMLLLMLLLLCDFRREFVWLSGYFMWCGRGCVTPGKKVCVN